MLNVLFLMSGIVLGSGLYQLYKLYLLKKILKVKYSSYLYLYEAYGGSSPKTFREYCKSLESDKGYF